MRGAPVIPGQYDPAKHGRRFATDTGSETLTQQQFREEADINTIVRRFGLTGELPQAGGPGMFGDFTGISDLESAIERVDEIRERFAALDPVVRDRFRNDPREMYRQLAGVSDEELVKATSVPEAVKPEEKEGAA